MYKKVPEGDTSGTFLMFILHFVTNDLKHS